MSLELLDLAPSGPYTYVTCGDDDARAFAQRIPNRLAGARALFVNRREGCVVTGADTPQDAARSLAEVAETVVVTLGPDGAFGMVEVHRRPPPLRLRDLSAAPARARCEISHADCAHNPLMPAAPVMDPSCTLFREARKRAQGSARQDLRRAHVLAEARRVAAARRR